MIANSPASAELHWRLHIPNRMAASSSRTSFLQRGRQILAQARAARAPRQTTVRLCATGIGSI
eukprot:2084408-Alexandrium_andersonii.AAC.1